MVRLSRPFHRTAPSRRKSGYISIGDDEESSSAEPTLRSLAHRDSGDHRNGQTIHAPTVKKLASGALESRNSMSNNKQQQRPSKVIVNISKAAMNSSLALTSREPTYCVMSDSSTVSADSYVLGLKSFSISEADESIPQHNAPLLPLQPRQRDQRHADRENNGVPPIRALQFTNAGFHDDAVLEGITTPDALDSDERGGNVLELLVEMLNKHERAA